MYGGWEVLGTKGLLGTAAGVGVGRLLTRPTVWLGPATRWFACRRWREAPRVVGDLWGGIRGSNLALISWVMSPTRSAVAPRRPSVSSDLVREQLDDPLDPLLLLPQDDGPLLSPLRVVYRGKAHGDSDDDDVALPHTRAAQSLKPLAHWQ